MPAAPVEPAESPLPAALVAPAPSPTLAGAPSTPTTIPAAPTTRPRPARRPEPPPAAAESALLDAAAKAEEERSRSTLVLAAIKALRTERDPERAQVLVEDYLRLRPDGPLVEEALLLQIEAAVALADPEAASLARRYLARFPDGRFRSAAQSAIMRLAPRAP